MMSSIDWENEGLLGDLHSNCQCEPKWIAVLDHATSAWKHAAITCDMAFLSANIDVTIQDEYGLAAK